MQYDLGHEVPLMSTQDLQAAKHEFLLMEKSCPQLGEPMNVEWFHTFEDVSDLRNITQKLLVRQQQKMRRLLSPKAWNLMLMIGDGVLFVSLIAFVLLSTPHIYLEPRVSSYLFGIRNLKFVWIFLAFVLWCITVKITHAQELANASNRFRSPLYAIFALVLMLVLWVVLTSSFIANDAAYINMLLIFLILAIPAFSTWRVVLAAIMSLKRFRPLAVIVGANTAGKVLTKELQGAKRATATILGYIDEGTEEKSKLNGLPILGRRSVLRYLVYNGMIDMIIVALDYKTNPGLFKEVSEATQFGISVLPMAVVYESNSGKIPVEHVGDQWHLALPLERILSPLYLCWRKVIDLVFGLCGLLLLCLVMPIIALLNHLDSPGPIFYNQERLGQHGKPFRIYKFRSMHVDAENEGRAIWASDYDPRITRVGRFLRATHLDELPQLLNILRGNMSLFGPRPERAEFVTELEKTIPFYRCRLAVKPGLTGWAQVKYRYGSTEDDAMIKLQYDLYYIRHQSFTLDLFIILKTVAEVLFARGV